MVNSIIKFHRYKKKVFYITCKHDIKIFKSILEGQYSIPECHVEKCDIVLDCGAHIGSFSYIASKKASLIFAFEPIPSTHHVFKKNIRLWRIKNIIPIKKAVYLDRRNCSFFVDFMRTDGSTLSKKRAKKLSQPKLIKVKCISIDNFVKEKRLKRVDFIKMDIEGAEIEALKGAKNTIKKFKPRMVIAAYHFQGDKIKIPKIVLSIRRDYKYKFVGKTHNGSFGDLFFW